MFILLILGFVNSQYFYPQGIQSQVQWTDQGQWVDCSSNQIIMGQSCNSSKSQIFECYLIPIAGLCSNQISNISASDQITLVFQIYNQNSSSLIIKINGAQQNSTLNLTSGLSQQGLVLKNLTGNIIMGLYANGSNQSYLQGAKLYKNQTQNCLIQNTTSLLCITCNSSYFMYSGQCVNKSCFDQIASIISAGMNSFMSYTNGQIVQNFQAQNGGFGDCYGLKVFLVANFDDLTPLYFFPTSNLTKTVDNKSLLLTDSLFNLNQIPCNQLQTPTQFVTQCQVSMAVTLGQTIQYQYLSQFRIMVDKTVSSSITFYNQSFVVANSSISVNVLSQAIVINMTLQGNNYVIFAEQQILDPYFIHNHIQLVSAQFISNRTFNLNSTTAVMNQSLLTITYQFILPQQDGIDLTNIKIQINSNVVKNRRILQQKIQSVNYYISSIVPYTYVQPNIVAQNSTVAIASNFTNTTTNTTTNSTAFLQSSVVQSNQDMNQTPLFVILIVSIIVFFIIVGYFIYTNSNKSPQAKNVGKPNSPNQRNPPMAEQSNLVQQPSNLVKSDRTS